MILTLLLLNSCVLGIYEDENNGNKYLKLKYPIGTPIVYKDGTYSKNYRYNSHRPQMIPVEKDNQ